MAPEFHETRMGRQFYERAVPELVRQVERLASAIEDKRPAPDIPAEGDPRQVYRPGDCVVILHNPFHSDCVGILGEVVAFRPGGGFMGWDLADVRYQSPRSGEWHERPFGTAALDPGSGEALLERAARHEVQAARMRAMAERSIP